MEESAGLTRLRKGAAARVRTLRGPGTSTVTVQPARARCAACTKTQVLLPAELQVRRADTTEVIGNALIHKANGLDSGVSPRGSTGLNRPCAGGCAASLPITCTG